ncbi:MAG TPA: penicillin acylase family protein [Rhodospirillales bacterium]|nr:penicillin acylase family protein [Rhodospirillales bacterium]
MLKKIGLGVIALLILVVVGGYGYLKTSEPKIDGTITVAGLGGDVTIVRDENGVPHIEGGSLNDALFGLGFVHVQDRLWQMDMNRRIGAGRLSELFGAKTLGTDKFLRTLDVYGIAERTVAKLSPETHSALLAYTAGVNAAISGWSGALPPEYLILGTTPEPWKPADSIVWVKMMAWDLGANWSKELLRLQMLQKGLSPQQVSEFMPPYRGEAAVDLSGVSQMLAGLDLDLTQLAAIAPPKLPEGAGSNNWVVDGSLSETGKPILANDPHLGLAAPAIWYFAHLKAPGLNAIGATLPGVPAIILGRNQKIAWGFTNTGPDVQDLYIEKLTGENEYLTPDGPAKFETREITINVKDQAPVIFTARTSRHGPIISDALSSAKKATPDGFVMAFAWTALRDDDLTADSALNLMRAENWDQFKTALRNYHAPQQNILYADIDGNIGYYAPARVPIRKPGNRFQGLVPVPGWDATYDWDGFIPFDELPQAYNPAKSSIRTANQKIVADDYPYLITKDWTLPYRADRIDQLLEARKKHSVASFQAMQADVTSLMALEMLPLMTGVSASDPLAKKALAKLKAWDGTMTLGGSEPLIFSAWLRELARSVYGDELGELFNRNWKIRPNFMANVLRDKDGMGRWCDDTTSAANETCAGMLRVALNAAITDLQSRFGDDMDDWTWGEAHFAHSDHNPMTNVPILRDLFDIKVPSVGGVFTINVGRFKLMNEKEPFANQHAASLRGIYDLSNLDRSLFIFSTGQSGNPLSSLYANFADKWSRTEYLTLTTDPADYTPGAMGTLILQPR